MPFGYRAIGARPICVMKSVRLLLQVLVLVVAGLNLVVSAAEEPKASEKEKEKSSWLDRVKGAVGLKKKAVEQPPPPPPAPVKKPAPEPEPKPKSKAKAASTSKAKPKPSPAPTKKASEKKAPPPSEPASSPPETVAKAIPQPTVDSTATVVKKFVGPPAPFVGPPSPLADDLVASTAESKPATKPFVGPPFPPPPVLVIANAKAETRKSDANDMSLDSEFASLGKDEPRPPATKADTNKPAPGTPPAPLPGASKGWQIFQHDGHDWVTAESMHAFYRFSEFKVSGESLWFKNPTMILKARVGSLDMLINNIKFVLSFPVTVVNSKVCFSRVDLSKLLDPVIRPWLITQSEPFDTVILDPGHGGHDSGAKGVYGYEKDFTLNMALSTRAALIKRGFKVVMTRQDDRFISLGGRAEFANTIPRSIFVSLHFNSSGSSASGIETFALTPQGSSSTFMGSQDWDDRSFTGNIRDAENIALATAVHAMVIHRYKLVDRGIKRARWSVLTGCTRPGILFEGGFVTNEKEGRLIASQVYRDGIASCIGDALLNYRAALHPRTAQKGSRR